MMQWFRKSRRSNASLTKSPQQIVPRVIALSMVKNEQDIIEPFIRHNIQFLDVLIIIDNGSVDKTRELATLCARELGNVIVADVSEFAYNQSTRMSRFLHCCQNAIFADFILFLDADEFIGSAKEIFAKELAKIEPGGIGLFPWRTYVVAKDKQNKIADPPRSLTNRRKTERPTYYKAVLRLDGESASGYQVTQGNHMVVGRQGALQQVTLDVYLLHYPVRSAAQLATKAVVGWAANLARSDLAPMQAYQWRTAFEEVARCGVAGTEKVLSEKSMLYAQDESSDAISSNIVESIVPYEYKRRYSDGNFADPVTVIARSWERSLRTSPIFQLIRPDTAAEPGISDSSFDASWHWDNLFLDAAPFCYIYDKYLPQSVLDIGCGVGQYLALYKSLGSKEVLGVDGLPALATKGVIDRAEYMEHDLATPLSLRKKFDAVICVEVAEHLKADDCLTLLDTVESHAGKYIIFSAAEIGQPGNRHINCQPISHWLDEWAARGWIPNIIDTLGMRAIATMSWFRRNLIVLHKGSAEDGKSSIEALIRISEKTYRWYSQPPGIRNEMLSEPMDLPNEGYNGSE